VAPHSKGGRGSNPRTKKLRRTRKRRLRHQTREARRKKKLAPLIKAKREFAKSVWSMPEEEKRDHVYRTLKGRRESGKRMSAGGGGGESGIGRERFTCLEAFFFLHKRCTKTIHPPALRSRISAERDKTRVKALPKKSSAVWQGEGGSIKKNWGPNKRRRVQASVSVLGSPLGKERPRGRPYAPKHQFAGETDGTQRI